ncbi:hypothetical protein IB285_00950 [Erythrobacter sp. KMU-140]|uniref:Esterase n=2 Tax=Erythrobacter rubeus TaxID=2760803 RepID=A0ABR8KNF6_9SPHN|nr:hypothetical protein [Erythrobacter rubeus]
MSFLRTHRYWLLPCLIFVLGYLGWTELTRTRGAQAVVFQPAEKDCSASGPLRYCVSRAKGGTNGDVVYHLHGRNLEETIWNDDTYYTGLIQAEWQRTGTLPPTVVTMSYGPTWLLAPNGTQPDSGLLEDFMKRMALIEEELGEPERRLLLGESMGGLNVLVAGLTYSSQFDKVAALCPGVYALSPFASFQEMKDAARRNGANGWKRQIEQRRSRG